jgi:hypothetical protein
MKRPIVTTALLGAAWLILVACVENRNPYPPMPPPMSETVPKPPVSARALKWQPGRWDWTGSAYVWVPGQYVSRSDYGNLWMPAYWERTESGWVWHPAHWE